MEWNQIEAIRNELLAHPMYKEMTNPDRVRVFMKHHVFAVWDFMSLLKRLQETLTSVSIPWMPKHISTYTRYVNEIVLSEESDEDGKGGYASHFQLYLDAMEEAKADTDPIRSFVKGLAEGIPYTQGITQEYIPKTAAEFVKFDLDLATKGSVHEVASAFFFGREGLIPDMFQVLRDSLLKEGCSTDRLDYYLYRHIELDRYEHGPLAQKLLLDLCEGDSKKEEEAIQVAGLALNMRKRLWDGVLLEIEEKGV